MANKLQARDGKAGLCWLLDVDSATESTTLTKGDIGFITGKAATSSAFGDMPLNAPFLVTKQMTLATGDKFLKATPYFMGFVTSKSVSSSKETQDVTTDYDIAKTGKSNFVTDGTVTKSGSLSGMNMLTTGMSNALNKIKTRFGSLVEIDGSGAVTYHEGDTTNKDVILIIWNYRECKTSDDIYDMEVLPVLFTSNSKGAQYGSAQNFDLDFSSVATDERGLEGGTLQVAYQSDLFTGSAWSVAR